MVKKKILVVLGGNSREREISLKTGNACIVAIKKLGYKVTEPKAIKPSVFYVAAAAGDLEAHHESSRASGGGADIGAGLHPLNKMCVVVFVLHRS